MKLFIEMLAESFTFILEGKGINEKFMRLLGFIINFIVMTWLSIYIWLYRRKK